MLADRSLNLTNPVCQSLRPCPLLVEQRQVDSPLIGVDAPTPASLQHPKPINNTLEGIVQITDMLLQRMPRPKRALVRIKVRFHSFQVNCTDRTEPKYGPYKKPLSQKTTAPHPIIDRGCWADEPSPLPPTYQDDRIKSHTGQGVFVVLHPTLWGATAAT